jgi:APA family basic amino acid/polyamine antiporter
MTDGGAPEGAQRAIGFWGCWALTVGTMIGAGVFMLPAVLAPYGLMSFAGWLLTAGGSIAIALVVARLASRTMRTGGLQVYVQEAFGRPAGFMVGWSYWIGCWISNAAVAIGFVGYLPGFFPGLASHPEMQVVIALALIWGLTLVALQGAKETSVVQLATTLMKLLPLLIVIGLGLFTGKAENLPPLNPTGGAPVHVLSAVAVLTMFAFLGFEYAAVPAGNVRDPQRTIPRALVIGVLTVTAVYIAATAAVMLLVPPDVLKTSTSPFADAARGLGEWGPKLVTLGALVSTAGFINGNVFITGQVAMAAAQDGMAPSVLARLNKAGAPWAAIVLGSVLGSVLVPLNYSRGLVGAFTFLLLMTTLTTLLPYLVCALAEIKASWRNARAWALVALIAGLYALFAIVGSGLEAILWCAVLTGLGWPVYLLVKPRGAVAPV